MAFGDDILKTVMDAADTVTRAVESGDFRNLSNDLSSSFNESAEKLRQKALENNVYRSFKQTEYSNRSSGINMTEQYLQSKKKLSVFQKNHANSIGSTISGIVYGFLTIIFFISTIATIPYVFSSSASAVGFIIFALATFFLGLGWKKAHDKKKMIKQFNLFKRAVGNREYITVKEFASIVQMPEQELKNSLKKMISSGMLLGARFDESETTLILSENALEEYQKYLQSMKEAELYNKFSQVDTEGMNVTSDSQKVIDEGNEYLVKVRRINDMIPDNDEEHMSDKLYALENIMKRIFEHVGQHPEKAQDLRKFMNYYLPTTQKLLDAYVQLDSQPQVGDNIKDTKKQISDALDTINSAFEKLFDDLFEEQAWDIASDISVMQTMMSQDGLVQSQN